MRSYTSLGQSTTDLTSVWSNFKSWWGSVESRLSDIINAKATIDNLNQRYQILLNAGQQIGDSNLATQANAGLNRLASLTGTWQEMKNRIDQYLPTWKEMKSYVGLSGDNQLGQILETIVASPWIIVAAVAALAYIVGKITDFFPALEREKVALSQLEAINAGKLTPQQAVQITQAQANEAQASTGSWMNKLPLILGLGLATVVAINVLPMLKRRT